MGINYLALISAIGMIVSSTLVFNFWVRGRFPFGDSCFARVVLFLIGFAAGFLLIWAFQPNDITSILCLGPIAGIGVGLHTGLLMPTIAHRIPIESENSDNGEGIGTS